MLLADENIPAKSISLLRARGVDIVAIAEIARGLTDEAVLQLAVEQQRALVSFDRDYGELIFREGKPAPRSIVYFRTQPQSPEQVAEILCGGHT